MSKKIPTNTEEHVKVTVSGTNVLPETESLPSNPNKPTHHADIVNMMRSSDGLVLLRFFSRAPGVNVEESRISFSQDLGTKLADLLCHALSHYPQNPSKQGAE